ncbi:beta-N-acetylhexosaminidase [Eubacterium ruminantium]|nr:beta-N-acetylhexosaminidase [Eubacterium ruminantium]
MDHKDNSNDNTDELKKKPVNGPRIDRDINVSRRKSSENLQYKKLKKMIIMLSVIVFILLISNLVLVVKLVSDSKERKKIEDKVNSGGYLTEHSTQAEGDKNGNSSDAADKESDNTAEASNNTGKTEAASNATETDAKENSGNSVDSKVDDIVNNMSLHDKICQMFIVTPEALTGYESCTAAGETTKECLKEYPVSGVIYFDNNLESREQVIEMTDNMQAFGKEINGLPLFISVDEEGGTVSRCSYKLGTTEFSNMYEYKDEGVGTAYENAKTIAEDIKQFGFNLDFAPVADTWSNSENTVIGRRAYSDDYEETAELVASAVKGFNDGGVICTLKHFPGHGDTAEDSHSGSAYVSKTLEELEEQEFLAFKSGIDAGAEMVMVGHITMTNVDNLPATISSKIITDELRGKLGYKGVVITDALEMGAISNNYSSEEISVLCIKAGVDIMLMPASLSNAVKGVEAAVESGELSEERINESVRRIVKLKLTKLEQ